MQIPRGVAVFNKYINNRIQGTWAWLLPPWAVVEHTGRRTGRAYRTPVVGFVGPDGFAVPILYGEGSDWVRNVLARGGTLRRGGRRWVLRDAEVVESETLTMSGLGGRYVRLAPTAFVARLARPA